MGCQKVVPFWGGVRGGGVGSCCVGVDFVNYPKHVTRKMGKISENYPKHDTRKMGSLLSSHIAFDPKREDKVGGGVMGRVVNVIDGDNVRQGLCRDLSFSPEGRVENLRRISAILPPLHAERERAREMINCGKFFERIYYGKKMGAAPRNKPVAVAHENPGEYGQGKRENMIEREVFSSSDF